MRILCLFMCACLLTGCASTKKLNDLEIGMTKAEVVKVMGTPEIRDIYPEGEILRYPLYNRGYWYWYDLAIKNGKLWDVTRQEESSGYSYNNQETNVLMIQKNEQNNIYPQ